MASNKRPGQSPHPSQKGGKAARVGKPAESGPLGAMLYKPLPQSDGQGARRSIDGKSRRDSVMTMARGLLSDSGKTHADRDIGESVLAAKLIHKVVVLDNTPGPKTPKPHSKGPKLSRKQQAALGLDRGINIKGKTFEDFVPLHRLWEQYIAEVVGTLTAANGATTMADRLVKADFHGAMISVVQSKNPGFVGTAGIVLQETENIFRVITRQHGLKTVPKAGNIFSFQHGPHMVTVYGNQIRFKSSERAVRKFKSQKTIEL